jgi:predicted esterase
MSSDALALHVHRWQPAGSGSDRTLVLLHGTGGNENDLLPLGESLLPGASLLSVRGNVLENGAPRFFRRIAEGVFDVEDLHRRTQELARFLAAAASHHGFPLERAHAVGFSNGANIAASLLLSHPGTIAGAVLFRAMVPFEPASPARLGGTAVLLSEGRSDPLIAPDQAERLAAIFREGGADVTLEWQTAGHQLTPGDLRVGQSWLAAHPPPAKSAPG